MFDQFVDWVSGSRWSYVAIFGGGSLIAAAPRVTTTGTNTPWAQSIATTGGLAAGAQRMGSQEAGPDALPACAVAPLGGGASGLVSDAFAGGAAAARGVERETRRGVTTNLGLG